jgi:2-polyprenyl-3-methyl-5-hydroxy-6-metoxy-1,4-benzoquinol methylase
MKEYYSKSVHYGIGHTRLKRILALAGEVSGKRILDIGCASGYVGAELIKRGAYVIGTDISEQAIQIAQKRISEAYVVEVGDILPAGMAADFDIVIMSEILEHIFEPEPMLKKVHTALKPTGSLIITTPNFLTWTNRFKFLFGRFKYQEQGMFDFGHIRWFTYSYLLEVLQASGFNIVEEKNIIFPGKLTKLLKRWPSLFAWQFIVKAKPR